MYGMYTYFTAILQNRKLFARHFQLLSLELKYSIVVPLPLMILVTVKNWIFEEFSTG